MATERGWIKTTATCPSCSNTDTIIVFGGNGDVVNKPVTCSSCSELYSAEVTITLTASVVNYEHSS